MKSLLVYKALILLTGFTLAYSIPIKMNVGDLVSNDRKVELEVVGQDSKTDTQNLNALVTKSEVTQATKKVTEGVIKDVTEEQTTTTTVKTTIEAKVQGNLQENVETTTAKTTSEEKVQDLLPFFTCFKEVQVNPQTTQETTTAKTSTKKNENLSVIVTESVHHDIVTQVVKNKKPETLVDSTQNQDTVNLNLDEPEINLTLQELKDLFENFAVSSDKKSKVNHGSSFRPNNAQYKHTESESIEESSESQESLSSESNSHEKISKRSSDDSDESSESSESSSNEKSVHHHHHYNEKVQENQKHGNKEEKVLANNKLTLYRPKLEVEDSILIQNL